MALLQQRVTLDGRTVDVEVEVSAVGRILVRADGLQVLDKKPFVLSGRFPFVLGGRDVHLVVENDGFTGPRFALDTGVGAVPVGSIARDGAAEPSADASRPRLRRDAWLGLGVGALLLAAGGYQWSQGEPRALLVAAMGGVSVVRAVLSFRRARRREA